MEFNSIEELNKYTNRLLYLGMGSQGEVYLNKNNKMAYKIFNYIDESDYKSDKNKEDILRFSNIKNKSFIWPNDVITINNKVVGYITKYVNAKNLYEINPLQTNLDTFSNSIKTVKDDIKLISNNGICTYDMMYNNMYNKKFYIIDQDEYTLSDKDSKIIEKQNNKNFDLELYYFLIDGYFNKLINSNKHLKELYDSKDEDILIFINELRIYLNELVGNNIKYLKEAKKYQDKEVLEDYYQRTLYR